LWIVVGDQNTKYFQKFANYWKIFNIIWELEDGQGNKKRGFSEPTSLGVEYFSGIFKELVQVKIGEILK